MGDIEGDIGCLEFMIRFFQRVGGQLLVRNFAILAVSEVLTRALTFVAFAYLARVLGPTVFGQNEIALAIMMVAMLVIDMGFPILGAREIARRPHDHDLVRRIVSTQVTLAVVVVGVMIGVAYLLPIHSVLRWLVTGYGLSLLLWPLQIMWVFQGRNRMVWMAVPQLFRYGMFAGLAVILVRAPEHVTSLPMAEIAAVVVAGAVLGLVYLTGSDRPRWPVGLAFDRALIREALPIGAANLLWAVRTFLPIVLLGWLLTEASAGLFGSSFRIMLAVHGVLTVYINNVFPLMSQSSHQSPEALTVVLRRSMPLLIWPMAAGAALATLFGYTVIDVIYGDQYAIREAYLSLTLLLWTMPVIACRRHCHFALLTLGHQVGAFRCALAGV
ncbi:MAG: hypothetical protein CMJ49_04765, partial [Planctomycetaceae bacterium]|nr:hypothetical protein [Planctomycetaceae bacterium]